MAWLNWPGRRDTAGAPERKDSRSGPLIALTGAGRARWTPRDYASLAAEGFGKNAVAYRCVRMIAEAAASTPLIVFVDGVRDDDHPAARLLRKPNPEQSGPEWLEGVFGALQTAGNAYVEAVGEGFSNAESRAVGPGRALEPEAGPGDGSCRARPAGPRPMNMRSAGARCGSGGSRTAGCR